ncbi:MAG: Crp/Fnr family transcriptional regulator [Nitrospinae bacterium]|nr:Crp/Fnr family transcriptional regulator [Nitrospinota bacterium]
MNEQLKKIRLFSKLSDETASWLASRMAIRNYTKGDYLFHEGEDAHKVYLVVKGSVKIVKEFASGKNAIMGIFGPGQMVAEVAAVDSKPYPASCVAMDEVTAAAIPSETFLELFRKAPEVPVMMIVGLGAKLRELTANLGSIAVQPVEKRLARLLSKLSADMGVTTPGGVALTLNMTRKDMAEIIGTSFEVVERSLKKLREDGVISVDGKKITIHKMPALEEIFAD